MSSIPTSLRRLVIQRSSDRCEYCCISQIGQVATFHIDHVIPVVAGGETTSDNLALACVSCSLRKGARQEIEDVETGETVNIFFQSPSTIMEQAFPLGRCTSCWINTYRTGNHQSFGLK